MQVEIKIPDSYKNNGGINLSVERGIYEVLVDLIEMDNNIAWDPVGAFFYLTGGYRVQRNGNGGALYDPYEQEIFLTNDHIAKLFAIAKSKNEPHGILGALSRRRSK